MSARVSEPSAVFVKMITKSPMLIFSVMLRGFVEAAPEEMDAALMAPNPIAGIGEIAAVVFAQVQLTADVWLNVVA